MLVVFCENLLEIILSFVVGGSKFVFFVGQNLNSRIIFILRWREYIAVFWCTHELPMHPDGVMVDRVKTRNHTRMQKNDSVTPIRCMQDNKDQCIRPYIWAKNGRIILPLCFEGKQRTDPGRLTMISPDPVPTSYLTLPILDDDEAGRCVRQRAHEPGVSPSPRSHVVVVLAAPHRPAWIGLAARTARIGRAGAVGLLTDRRPGSFLTSHGQKGCQERRTTHAGRFYSSRARFGAVVSQKNFATRPHDARLLHARSVLSHSPTPIRRRQSTRFSCKHIQIRKIVVHKLVNQINFWLHHWVIYNEIFQTRSLLTIFRQYF